MWKGVIHTYLGIVLSIWDGIEEIDLVFRLQEKRTMFAPHSVQLAFL